MNRPNLHDFDLVAINSSAGKDSQTALRNVVLLADAQGYDRSNLVVIHADLGSEEWPGVPELAQEQAEFYGLEFHKIARTQADGSSDSILDYTKRRGMWPSSTTRWCTSDFKRDPCAKLLRRIAKDRGALRVLNVFGFRAEESPARAKRETFTENKRLSNKTRKVFDWLPIHNWTETEVWDDIKVSGVPYHNAYDLGMPRLSCCFCVFAPFEALVIAGKANPELLNEYVEVEKETGHLFRKNFSLVDVLEAVRNNQEVKVNETWAC